MFRPILSHPACWLNSEILGNFEQGAVVEITLVCDERRRRQNHTKRERKDYGVKVAGRRRFRTVYLPFWTHSKTSILQVGNRVIADLEGLRYQLKHAYRLVGVHVRNENIADKFIATGNVEFHPFLDAVRRPD